jgi:hypothetical protein
VASWATALVTEPINATSAITIFTIRFIALMINSIFRCKITFTHLPREQYSTYQVLTKVLFSLNGLVHVIK